MRPVRSAGVVLAIGALAGLTACGILPSGGPTGPTVTITTAGTVPWLAAQDGSGPWKTLSGTSFPVLDGSGRYGVAWACNPGSAQPTVHVVQATIADGASVTATCQAASAATTYSITGTLYGVPSGVGVVAIGTDSTQVAAPTPKSYTLPSVPAGEQALLAYGYTNVTTPGNMVVERNLSIDADASLGNTYLTGGLPFSFFHLQLSSVPSGESASFHTAFVPAGNGIVDLNELPSVPGVAYPAVPGGYVRNGDTYQLSASASTSGYSSTTAGYAQETLSVDHVLTDPTVLALPGVLPRQAAVSVSGGVATAAWGSVTFGISSGATAYRASVTPASSTFAGWTATISAGWLGGATSYAFPDFSGTTGWQSAWAFPTGTSAAVHLVAARGNLPWQRLFDPLETSTFPNGTLVEQTRRTLVGSY